MNKFILFTILLVSPILSFSQSFKLDSVILRTNNGIVDSLGRKQCEWKYFKDFYYKKTYSKDLYDIEKRTSFIMEGRYVDDKKIGKWTYYNDIEEEYCWEYYISPSYYITYFEDGSRLKEYCFKFQTTFFNKDSSIVKIVLERNNTPYYKVFINGEKSDGQLKCELSSGSGKVLDVFPYSELDLYIMKFDLGEYDRVVKKLNR